MEPAQKPNQPYDDQGDQPLSARERADQRWGMSQPDNSAQGGGGDTGGRPDLRVLEGGGETTPRRDFRTTANGGTADAGTLSSSENRAAGDQIGKGYNAGADSGERHGLGKVKLKAGGWWNKRRAGIAGGAASGVTVLLILALGVLSGPAEFLKITAALSHAFTKNDTDTSQRIQEIFMSTAEELLIKHVTSDAAKTKAQLLSVKVFGNPVEQLRDVGVTFDKHFIFGQATKLNFNTDKLKNIYPDMDGMTDAQTKEFLGDLVSTNKLTITPDQIAGSDGKYSIDVKGFGLGALGALGGKLGKSTLPLLDNGKVGTWMQVRILKSFTGVPGFLHPLKRTIAAAERKYVNGTAAQREKAVDDADEQDFTDRNAPLEAKAEPLAADVKSKNALFNSTASSILLYTGSLCFVHATADAAEALNYATATQTAVEALYRNAIGDQIKSNSSDITQAQLAVEKANLTDSSGHDYFSAMPYQQLATGSHYTGSYDIPAIYQQAYSSNSTARNIKNGVDDALGGSFSAGLICSPTGLVLQAGFSLAQYVGDFITEVGTLGAGTPGVAAQLAAKFALTAGPKLASQFLVSALAMNFLKQIILNKTTATLGYDAFKGAGGGELDPYAMRFAANLAATSSGGVSQGNNNSVIGLDSALQSEKQQFESQGFFARMFNVKESQSLLNSIASSVSPSFSQNLLSTSHNFLNIGSVLTGDFLNLLPHAAADSEQSTNYDWTFPQDGLPPNMLSDPLLAFDDNQDAVAGILNTECPNGDMTGSACSALAQRVDACFGNQFVYSDNLWDVQKVHAVDPQSQTYIDADCADVGDASNTKANDAIGQWRRIIMFIFDTHDMKTAACFNGDAQSCTDEGSDVLR